MSKVLLLFALTLTAVGCGGGQSQASTETTLPMAPGACVSLSRGTVVAFDSEGATHRLLRVATLLDYDLTDASASPCDDDEVAIDERRIETEGPLTGASSTVDTWCAEAIEADS